MINNVPFKLIVNYAFLSIINFILHYFYYFNIIFISYYALVICDKYNLNPYFIECMDYKAIYQTLFQC